ncbi:MAG: PP2C family protein-serine/threonine phosphatase [Rubinisphaera brasiliensis]|uniref:Protein serine/threonine phosphatase n=1 Tax=Rubinisphaera brasiliensis (strain ATCC 49424 / DSM 5305 / JCM 21570 / IAM 15109 / NBRC 103401 / IFAM 1448) TaxID=756272 RepID=F0SM53_RUBBR|nr:protein phosphatase 2C domain-containing protein [Rubinisphaera brasiliensis]ADY61008.1 protein serine/threonine phosphatase [Rubinisphaera brasiliensis DSM 5305]MBR9803770.1 serine/threonine-protein phosphatase [bacterium]
MSNIRIGQLCITGNYRQNNEDNLYIDPDNRFFIVADGMGGQSAGEKASQLAVELVPKKLIEMVDFLSDSSDRVHKSINEAVCHANGEIMALGRIDPDMHNMGTTIVLIVSVADQFYIGNVGDSRCYLLRDGKLTLLTKDHSLTQALVEAGTISADEARSHRYKNVLYRYLGSKEGAEGAYTVESTPQPGDRFLLCSDGVTDGLEDSELQKVLAAESEPQELADSIVLAAQKGGSKDNITCVVLQID